MRFSKKMWAQVREENPESQLWDIGRVIGQLWRETPDSEKSVFQAEYDADKIEYEKAMKNYQSSPAYQQYVQQRNRQKQTEKAQTSRNRTMDNGGVVIQPVDEDEAVNEFSLRKFHHQRYEKNQRMMADLFSPYSVQDTRMIVSQSRIDMLRKQAQSLAAHQTKLEDELKKLDESFAEKKKSIQTGRIAFNEQMEKAAKEKPSLDEANFQELLVSWEKKLLDAYAVYQKQIDDQTAKQDAEREKSTLFAMVAANDDEKPEETNGNPENTAASEDPQGMTGNQAEAMDTTNSKETSQTPDTSNDQVSSTTSDVTSTTTEN
ncbi:unnamed protein product, partial [Mesorhabditis spiculigera]